MSIADGMSVVVVGIVQIPVGRLRLLLVLVLVLVLLLLLLLLLHGSTARHAPRPVVYLPKRHLLLFSPIPIPTVRRRLLFQLPLRARGTEHRLHSGRLHSGSAPVSLHHLSPRSRRAAFRCAVLVVVAAAAAHLFLLLRWSFETVAAAAAIGRKLGLGQSGTRKAEHIVKLLDGCCCCRWRRRWLVLRERVDEVGAVSQPARRLGRLRGARVTVDGDLASAPAAKEQKQDVGPSPAGGTTATGRRHDGNRGTGDDQRVKKGVGRQVSNSLSGTLALSFFLPLLAGDQICMYAF